MPTAENKAMSTKSQLAQNFNTVVPKKIDMDAAERAIRGELLERYEEKVSSIY